MAAMIYRAVNRLGKVNFFQGFWGQSLRSQAIADAYSTVWQKRMAVVPLYSSFLLNNFPSAEFLGRSNDGAKFESSLGQSLRALEIEHEAAVLRTETSLDWALYSVGCFLSNNGLLNGNRTLCTFLGLKLKIDESRLREDDSLCGSFAVDRFADSPELNQAHTRRPPRLTVIVPVHNNADFLLSKCLPSLTTNRIWNSMEVLIVDDCSTDPWTKSVLDVLENVPQIIVHRLRGRASGSASRPRNEGVQMAKGEYVAFLDPDNKISPGGYDYLLEKTENKRLESPVDFVSGYQVKVGLRGGVTARNTFRAEEIVTDPYSSCFAHKFPTISTQAAVIRRKFLLENRLHFVDGAVGQDTLFGWEILAASRITVFVSNANIYYFSDRKSSITNVSNLHYFEKALVRERAQVEFLRKAGLLDLYKERHLSNFVRNWYVPRVEKSPPAERERAEELLRDIIALYSDAV